MEYTLIHNDRSYDLPKFTKSVKNKIERINSDNESKSLNDDEKYKRMLTFIKEMIGDENALELFGTDDMDDIDLNEIAVCYISICNSYDKQVNLAQSEMKSKISNEDRQFVMDLLKNAGSIENIMKDIGNVSKTPVRAPFRTL